ncbi:patatin-like phospholipase family protein [Sulfurovum riftiae]|uniref:Patatin n=1 Tax=Sulfurovum riftiae TaxID=1630136 RepID=A0A151CDZ2_9BACT|nr:patatin-like phospholipase family protein [Sulfurovum riftiae]KYJ85740.1 patatin [Sulfurovum riftiae]
MIEKLRNNDFSLVLSGGGALGISHLGILHDLEKESVYPSEIVGTSMGGIVGACVAIGMQEAEIYEQIKKFSNLFNWMKFSFSGNAMIDNEKIALIFETLFGNRKMKETDIPLKLIATNLLNGHKRVFTAEDDVLIKDAILCTMAIPGIFEEHIVDGEVYGDGFLCENLGVREASFKTVLAVDVLGENSFEKEMPDSFFKTANMMEMFEKSVRLLIYNQSRSHIACSTKEILLIEPETKGYKTFHFHKYEEIRKIGLGLLK